MEVNEILEAEMGQIYAWDDMPDVRAWLENTTYRDGSPRTWLHVEKGGKRLYKQSWLERHEQKGIEVIVREGIKSHYDTIEIFKLECPDCGAKLIDNTIKEGSHKGHGNIACPECGKVKVWI